jgi:hypothetical protein
VLNEQLNQEVLTLRNKVLRKELHSIDESAKQKAERIGDEMSKLFKLLDVKASIKELEDDPQFLEIKINFSNGKGHQNYIVLIYDIVTNDYDCEWIFSNDEMIKIANFFCSAGNAT